MGRFWHILSIALITAGVVIVADVGVTLAYKEPLSSIYGSIKQDEAQSQLNDLEASYPSSEDRRAVAKVKVPREQISILAERFAAEAETGQPIGKIVAPDMDGLDLVMVQGTDSASLEKGPGHYPETPFPGEGSTVGIAGHRTTYLAPFRHIDSMQEGDPIKLEMPYGNFVYKVQKTEIVDPSDVGIVKKVGYERLVLSACNPLYSAEQRFIVFAKLVRETVAPGV
ncbi:MAG TPA: class E sortase [Solirubrobacterales bacterium]|jgi:sortase A|nr:class E sortase [Solirubrobacterales bacterium]